MSSAHRSPPVPLALSAAFTLADLVLHSSQIPGMGNKDLRLLQTLINDEKSVLTSHDRLAKDTSAASTSLAAWGNSEGQDLSDVLTKAGEMLGLLVSLQSRGNLDSTAGGRGRRKGDANF